MRYLKTNTATTITVGPFLDKTDGITPETAITVTGVHITFMVDNAGTPTLAIDADATASGGNNDMVHITGDDAGYYSLELTAAQTNYLGGALLSLNVVGTACPVFHEFTILPANIYDSMIAGTDLFDVSVTQFGGSAGTFASGRPEVNTTHAAGTAWGSGAITLAAFAADAKALMGVVAFGTAQSVTNTSVTLANTETVGTNDIIGTTILIRTATTGFGQPRSILAYDSATKVATVDAFNTTPTGAVTYVIFATSPGSTSAPIAVNVTQWNGSAVATPNTAGVPKVDAVAVSGTTQTARDLGASVIAASVTGNVGGNVVGSVGSVTGAVGSVTGNVGGNVTGSVGSVVGAVGSVTGNVGGNVVGSVASVTAGVTVTTNNDKTGYALSAAGVDAVWDEATSGHTTAGTTGKALTDAGSSGDPWSTALPGSYGAGTAGKIVGDNLNATVGSRLASAGYTAPLDAAGTRSAVGLSSANLDAQLSAIAGYINTEIAAILAAVDTEVAAIKAKTDNLPTSPAAAGDAMTLTAGAVDAILDDTVEGSVTVRQMLRGFASALLAKASGLATTTAVYRDVSDTKNRITATVDADGNRSAVTLDLT